MNFWYDTAKNGIFSWIFQDRLDQFLQSFHHMKVLWVHMIDLDLVFRFVKGRCHGNQIMLGKSNERRLIPPAFFALAFKNKVEYHYPYVCINSSDDQATSDINLAGFCPVPPEFMRINCVHQASISNQVSISTVAKWQHGYLSLLLARRQHCNTEWAIC